MEHGRNDAAYDGRATGIPSHLWNPKWKTTWRKTSRKIPKKTKELDPMEKSKRHTFAPLQTQNLRKNSSNFFRIFARISATILIFQQVSSNFAQILMIFFSRNFAEHSRKCCEVLKFSEFLKNCDNFAEF